MDMFEIKFLKLHCYKNRVVEFNCCSIILSNIYIYMILHFHKIF